MGAWFSSVMLDIYDQPPDLTGKVCEAFWYQEYWYQGQRTHVPYIHFLKIKGGGWHRFFFEYGSLFWKEYDARDEVTTTINDQFHFPQFDLSNQIPIVGRAITKITVADRGDREDLILSFENQIDVVLENDGDDNGSLSVVLNGHRHTV